MSQQTKKVLVFVTDGSEDIEAVTSIDVFRRAELDVTVAGVALKDGKHAVLKTGVTVVPDKLLTEIPNPVDTYDAFVVPGGLAGAKTLATNPAVRTALGEANKRNKLVAAICAGPLTIKEAGIHKGRKLTSHPSLQEEFKKDYTYSEDRVVEDGYVITSRGPGTAMLFALTIVETLLGKEKRDAVAKPMMLTTTL